jgi:Acetyltransferase (GNAT) domain
LNGGYARPIVAISPVSPGKRQPPVSEVYRIDPLTDTRWSALVERHLSGSVFHSTNWLGALRAVYDYDILALTTCPPSVPLSNGIVFCRIKSWLTGKRLVSLPFSDHCEPLIERTEDGDAILLNLSRRALRGNLKYIEIRPTNYQPGTRTRFGNSVAYSLHALDLRPSERELFETFHKSCVQRKIRRAEREHLGYEKGISEMMLRKFYTLMVMTRRRQGLPPQPLSWFRGLTAAFGSNVQIRVASKNSQPIAAIFTLSHKKTVTYKYGCSNAPYNRFGAMSFLFWQAIQEARVDGFEHFEMGRSDPSNSGLIAFKEHWGTTRTAINYWNYPQSSAEVQNFARNLLVRKFVSKVPSPVLETVGSFLYKHIG